MLLLLENFIQSMGFSLLLTWTSFTFEHLQVEIPVVIFLLFFFLGFLSPVLFFFWRGVLMKRFDPIVFKTLFGSSNI